MEGSHTRVLTSSNPCPHYLCLNMPRLSCVNLWVRYLSCSAKHLASVTAKLPVCPSPPTPFGSLLPRAGRSVLFLCWDALGIASPHPLCCAWVRQVGPESHPPLPSQQLQRRVAGGGGCLCWLRARARQAQHAPVRAPRASSPALGAAFVATVCSPGPLPSPSLGFCPLGRLPRGRKTSSRRMPGPVSTATAAGRAGTERGRKMVFGPMTLPAGGLEP